MANTLHVDEAQCPDNTVAEAQCLVIARTWRPAHGLTDDLEKLLGTE